MDELQAWWINSPLHPYIDPIFYILLIAFLFCATMAIREFLKNRESVDVLDVEDDESYDGYDEDGVYVGEEEN